MPVHKLTASSSLGDMYQLVAGADDLPKAPPWQQGSFTAKQLQAMEFPAISWVLQDIIHGEGLTLLCSKPKFGKSWLAYDLCIACTMGRLTLGNMRPAQGDVLYLALEDSRRRLQRRMTKLLPTFGTKWPDSLTITTEWRRLHEGGLDDIRDWYVRSKNAGGKPIMVVIDVLAKVRKPAGNKSLYDADYEAVGMLAHLSHELGLAIVVIHHTRKMAADDLMETVSGSFGTTGAADTVLVLASKASGAVLDIRGRDVESAEKALEFNKNSCKWTILGNSAEIHISAQRSKILAALKDAAVPMTITELMAAADMKRNPLELLLGKMAKEMVIQRVAKGLYAHNDYVPPPPPDKPGKARSASSVSSVSRGQVPRQINQPAQPTEDTQNKGGICLSVPSVRESTDGNGAKSSVKTQTDRTDGQIDFQVRDKSTISETGGLSGRQTDQTDRTDGHGGSNGRAVDAMAARVTIRQIRPPAISAGPTDSLDDFAPS